jgi:hypothetical protein
MKRLNKFVQAVEARYSPEADFDQVIAHEHAISKSLNGRSVFDDAPAPRTRAISRGGQLSLFTPD